MKKLIIMAAMLLSLAGAVFANGLENKNAIGIYVIGSESAVGGIQYERHFTDLISTKFGVYAMYDNNSTYNPYDVNFSVETDFKLFETNWKDKVASRLFAYALAGYMGSGEYSIDYSAEDPETTKKYIKSNDAVASLGFGFDFIFFDHLSIPVQFGFMGTFPDTPNVAFCGGIALRYTW